MFASSLPITPTRRYLATTLIQIPLLTRRQPSLEIFAFHPLLNKWVEVGNSGMFRPEMLEPMGYPKDVRVHGWGLSLERPTMIR
jgi:hypothetical protein